MVNDIHAVSFGVAHADIGGSVDHRLEAKD